MTRAPMTSGELARAAGVNVETLRYYERRGILPEPARTSSGHRRYGVESLELLRLVKRAQELGFSLPDIAELIAARANPEADCRDVCAAVQERLDHVDRQIVRLTAQRERLARLRDACPRPRLLSECPVLDELASQPAARRKDSS